MVKMILLILAALIAVQLAWDIPRTIYLIKKTFALEAAIKPFDRAIPNAQMKILVLGDSTAVGTGVIDPKNSTAGRLGQMYPQASVTNLAVNGLKLAGLLKIMDGLSANSHFNLILIQIGANDIIQLTNMGEIEKEIGQVLMQAKTLGDKVIVLHSGNIGESLFWPWYLQPLYSHRSFEARDIYMRVASSTGASYVDLIDSNAAKSLREDPYGYYAADLLHLNDPGYGLWFEEIKKKL